MAPKGEVTDGGTLVVGLAAEASGWDPTDAQWAALGIMVAQTIFDPLAVFSAEGRLEQS